jgi:DNA-binding transcriptional MerR regulator
MVYRVHRKEEITVKIKDVETATELPRANIRFYEKEGLLHPVRSENNYREYTDEDVEILKKISLLRRVGLSIEDLKALFAGTISLQEALTRAKARLDGEIAQLQASVQLCEEMQRNQETIESLRSERYTSQLDKLDPTGLDFLNRS